MANSPLYPRSKKPGRKKCHWTELSNHLKAKSKEICEINGCKGGEHYCESYAYITEHGVLLDVCLPDYAPAYFSGGGPKSMAAIPMPWTGCGRDLKKAVEDDTY